MWPGRPPARSMISSTCRNMRGSGPSSIKVTGPCAFEYKGQAECDAEYDDFVYTKPNFNGGFGNGTGCPNVGVPGPFYTVDCSGERPPNAPEWTINVGAQQTFTLGSGASIVGSVRAHYQTETLTGLEFTADEMQDSYTTLDALLTYSSAADRFSVSAFVNNATDETVKSEAFPAPFSLFTTAILRPPRTYGMRIGVRF